MRDRPARALPSTALQRDRARRRDSAALSVGDVRWRRRSAVVVTLAYFALGLVGISRHEMWRDELHTFMVSRASGSLVDLMANTGYDGHPALWYLIVFAIGRVLPQPFFVQLAHLFVATATCFVISRFAPFSTLQRVLLCFGYYTFFEYSVISRNYAVGVLIIFIFCAIYRRGPAKPYLL